MSGDKKDKDPQELPEDVSAALEDSTDESTESADVLPETESAALATAATATAAATDAQATGEAAVEETQAVSEATANTAEETVGAVAAVVETTAEVAATEEASESAAEAAESVLSASEQLAPDEMAETTASGVQTTINIQGRVPEFPGTPFYRPDPELAVSTGHISYLFHVLIDLRGFGDFHALENLRYSVPAQPYWEGGRNYAPHMLPFGDVGSGGELTLRWGMVNRPWLYEWMREVDVGGRFRRSVVIFHLDRRKMPVRIIRLTNAWPVEWSAPTLNTLSSEYPIEQLTLAYEGIRVFVNSLDVQAALDKSAS